MSENRTKQTIKGESGTVEKASFICDLFLLAVFIWDQVKYGLNMLYLIIPLVLIGAYLYFFCIIPEEYCFLDNSLRINHKLRKQVLIQYDSVFNFEASAHDGFINIGQKNKVKLYCQIEGKKKAIVCRPSDVETFTNLIKANCSEFYEETDKHSRIEVFFGNQK